MSLNLAVYDNPIEKNTVKGENRQKGLPLVHVFAAIFKECYGIYILNALKA